MRYRRLSPSGDRMFGSGLGDFWIDVPEAVAQSVLTRLMLWQGQWFYDRRSGTPWLTEVLGERTQGTRDLTVRERVRETIGVTEIVAYTSHLDRDTRRWHAAMNLNTAYGEVALATGMLDVELPTLPPPGITLAETLGVVGADVTAQRADLTRGPRTDIREFVIQRVDRGEY